MNTNVVQQEGYGADSYTDNAIKLIKSSIGRDDIDIHFISGGTQANLITIDAFLKSYEACISADTGHIAVHEAGAIECTGHKIITIKTKDGKITTNQIKEVLDYHEDEHFVKPKLVYISNSTELGTIYKKNELKEISEFCKKNNLIFYLDGARIGSAICSKESDFSLADICEYTDAFYIGGTKNGALMGEAIIIKNKELKKDFRYAIKQKGGLFAKGRVLGIQFEKLFEDGLYCELAIHANKMAEKLKTELLKMGISFLTESSTNQIFPILKNDLIERLLDKYSFYIYKKIDDNKSAVRLVTSWATREEYINEFINEIKVSKSINISKLF